MAEKNVLLVGESWATFATHTKGFDHFNSVTFHLGAEPLATALKNSEFVLTYMPAHEAATTFPFDLEELRGFDAIILSDIGANTFLLPPSVWLNGKPTPNRLKLIREWTGGGLLMMGEYLSFQGIDGKVRWRATPVEDALPVACLPYDDRLEIPEGFAPRIVGEPAHPILPGIEGAWPLLLGANEVRQRKLRAFRFSLDSQRRRADILCSSPASSARAARSPGPRTSGLTGCQRALSSGRATGACGSTRYPGRPA